MKKDFGLKVTDIRNMQSHDKKLALELAKLETMDQEQRRASKFKISQGILYHSSQKDNSMQLCVSLLGSNDGNNPQKDHICLRSGNDMCKSGKDMPSLYPSKT